MTGAHPKHQSLRYAGLNASEVEASRSKHGTNVLTPPQRDTWWRLYVEKFGDPVIRILIVAAIISLVVGIVDGTYVEGLGIILAIFLATTLSFVNEYRAAKEFDILNQVNNVVPVKVIRDSAYATVPRKDIVVDDIVLLEMGDEVPSDGEILEAVSLEVDESCLTGESSPVVKTRERTGESGERESVYPSYSVFRGTFVRDGRGTVRVSAVGDTTEIGRLAKPASDDPRHQTPLKRQLERLSKLIGVSGFLAACLTFMALVVRGVYGGHILLTDGQWVFAGILTVSVAVALTRVWAPIARDARELLGKPLEEPRWLTGSLLGTWLGSLSVAVVLFGILLGMGYGLGLLPQSPIDWLPGPAGHVFLSYFMIAVTIIVVAAPEGLPMSVTLSLAYNMRKMAAANNLVRHMHACETIGACSVICSDKTGTLTRNEMRVASVDFPSMTGHDGVRAAGQAGQLDTLIGEALSANSTANLIPAEGTGQRVLGNPTEGALLLWLDEMGTEYTSLRHNFSIQRQWTFSTDRKFMGTLGISAIDAEHVLHVKGAPEIVLERCESLLSEDGPEPLNEKRPALDAALKQFQRQGMRTLGFAYKTAVHADERSTLEDLAQGMTWLGFVAIADPVRPDVPAAVLRCLNAGIAVKIVTGDNPETATEIARQIGLWDRQPEPDRHLTGQEFASLPDDEASRCAGSLKVLSRARPLDKLRLVKLLQKAGNIVAVTGDGTNDAPALNHADVGLSMGASGTSLAKEASDIVLLDDSFASIANAVMWGRSLYENIQRFMLFQLTINVTALGIALLGPFIGVQLPLTVTQMLWVNLIMDTFAALALATEPPCADVMKRPPRNPEAFIVTRSMARNIIGKGTVFLVLLVLLLLHIQADNIITDYELSVFFTVFVMLQFWNLFNARCYGRDRSAFWRMSTNKGFVLIGAAILVGQILIVEFGASIFRTVPLSLQDWAAIVAGTSLVLWGEEVVRLLHRIRTNRGFAGSGSS